MQHCVAIFFLKFKHYVFFSCLSFSTLGMSQNSSSSNSSLHSPTECFRSETTIIVFFALFIANILLLPVFIFVIYLAVKKLRQQCSKSSTAKSRSDLFTYHAVGIHVAELLGMFIFCLGSYTEVPHTSWLGQVIIMVTCNGKDMFHVLTCVEHHLAVLHPITYVHLKQAGEATIRHISAGFVWLLSLGWVFVNYVADSQVNIILVFCAMVSNFTVICFCSISVLCVLKRPWQGDEGGKERVDQSKQRASHTVMAIIGALLVRFLATLIACALYISPALGSGYICAELLSIGWFSLPSSLVLPLLFLHREGKLLCLKQNTASE